MDLIVARLAQRHEVAVRVRASTGYRHDVMYFLHRCDLAFLEALFTQGVSCHIPSTYSVPRSAVLAGSVGCSTVSVIFLPCLLAVLLAVRTVCQVGTAGVCTRSLWLPRHYFFFLRKIWLIFHFKMYQHCSKAPTFLYAIYRISFLKTSKDTPKDVPNTAEKTVKDAPKSARKTLTDAPTYRRKIGKDAEKDAPRYPPKSAKDSKRRPKVRQNRLFP